LRIRLDIDENLLSQAMALSPGKTEDAVINEALAEYVSRKRRLSIIDLFGKIDYDPDYDYKAESVLCLGTTLHSA